MSDICDFTLKARGPTAELEKFKGAVLKDAEPMPVDSPFHGEHIFTLRPENWGILEGSQEVFWLKEVKCYCCQRILGHTTPEQDQMVLVGYSQYCPPLVFVERAMEKFPGLEFDLHGTTEHAFYEHWQSVGSDRGRRLVCREERHTDLAKDEIVYLMIDGQEILARQARENDPETAELASAPRPSESGNTNWPEEGF